MNPAICSICNSPLSDSAGPCAVCGTPTAAGSRSLPVGTHLQNGKYSLGRILGEGGFGITYLGAHRHLQLTVAIKELFPERAMRHGTTVSVPDSQQNEFHLEKNRVLEEALTISRINFPGVVAVHDAFLENGTAYMVMEYLKGQSLQERIESEGPLPPDDVHRIAIAVCDALIEVHRQDLLHRDIKPANIMLTRDGRVVLIDFGSARTFDSGRTVRHTQILTRDYAAPEMFSTQARFGPYTDLFCLGGTLFHALTGQLPPAVMDRLQDESAGLELPDWLNRPLGAVICQALQVRIKDRPQSIAEFKQMLDCGPRSSCLEPYVFKGVACHTPSDLASALAEDWDAAVKDWSSGRIRTWIEDKQRDPTIRHAIHQTLQTPLFIQSLLEDEIGPHASDCLERQLTAVLVLLDTNRKPTYRGIPLQNQEALRVWLNEHSHNFLLNSSHRDMDVVLSKCFGCAVPLVVKDPFFHKLYEDVTREFDVAWHLLEKYFLGTFHEKLFNVKYKKGVWLGCGTIAFHALARDIDALCGAMQADCQAMGTEWFAHLVAQAHISAGTATVLEILQPVARAQSRMQAARDLGGSDIHDHNGGKVDWGDLGCLLGFIFIGLGGLIGLVLVLGWV